MDDIELKTETQKLKFRVSGITIRDGKILTLLMKNKTTYCLPGGHIEMGEDSKSTVLREIVWLDLDSINSSNLIPGYLKEKLGRNELSFEHLIVKE